MLVAKKVLAKKEEFISYEQWQNINAGGQMFQMDPNIEGTWVLVGDAITDQERQVVDNYIDKILVQRLNDHDEVIIRLK